MDAKTKKLIDEYIKASDAEAAAKAAKEQAKTAIYERLGVCDIKEEEYRVKVSEVEPSLAFDVKRFKEERPRIYAAYMTAERAGYVKVTAKRLTA